VGKVVVTHRIDSAAIQALLTSPNGGVVKDLIRRGVRVQTAAKKNISGANGPKRVNSGRLRGSIQWQLYFIAGIPAVRVGTNVKYGIFVHQGTGLYGPRGEVIRPKSAKFLVFKSQAYGAKKGKFKGKVVVPYVKGMKPNHFLKNALSAARI
jgi:hypothetical protein